MLCICCFCFSFDLKGEDLDVVGLPVIDYTPFLKFEQRFVMINYLNVICIIYMINRLILLCIIMHQ